jgi:hypothetical protein
MLSEVICLFEHHGTSLSPRPRKRLFAQFGMCGLEVDRMGGLIRWGKLAPIDSGLSVAGGPGKYVRPHAQSPAIPYEPLICRTDRLGLCTGNGERMSRARSLWRMREKSFYERWRSPFPRCSVLAMRGRSLACQMGPSLHRSPRYHTRAIDRNSKGCDNSRTPKTPSTTLALSLSTPSVLSSLMVT